MNLLIVALLAHMACASVQQTTRPSSSANANSARTESPQQQRRKLAQSVGLSDGGAGCLTDPIGVCAAASVCEIHFVTEDTEPPVVKSACDILKCQIYKFNNACSLSTGCLNGLADECERKTALASQLDGSACDVNCNAASSLALSIAATTALFINLLW